ncbi:peptidase C11, clostripain [Seminavis robusta]|uniref:Peptidase C11, clostripain n=1 Tax=Seminavis robusta TaxID=568900 RepID=A0A9N8HU61_9STRA|nr:peptidase C11, clostripain [Seminavis robusta]|eukprot:Sro1608_g285680.1 peptidase C11, clostripain (785) ;mRNA; r:11881-14578
MRFEFPGSVLFGALAMGLLAPLAEAKTCFMLYQMADNNLEYYLRQDYEELTNSGVIRSGDLRTWIYYDALNQGGDPLPNTVDEGGNPLTQTFTGSRYLTWDASLNGGAGGMKVDRTLQGEQNSDTQAVIQAFLTHALQDCLANGYDSLMAIFSSHGGGFAGYGGDENTRRKLLQTNQGLVNAIRGALDANGISGKLDVVGFDACLMQAVGAADDYKAVASHILASEAVEPGHGWAYSFLNSATDALDLAVQILRTFIAETQGGSSHQSPKTMAIVNTDKFLNFLAAFENFSKDLLSELKTGDSSLHAFVSRARASAVAFEGIVDVVGTLHPSGLDIGSFLEGFKAMCNPNSVLGGDLDTAIANYDGMFVEVGIGQGTQQGTGMHITWPNQAEYVNNQGLWDQVLFNNENYVTEITPQFRAFLEWFLPSGSPNGNGANSVCQESATAPGNANGNQNGGGNGNQNGNQNGNGNALLISESTSEDSAGNFNVEAQISSKVSQVLVEYGIDLSTPLKPVLREKGYEPEDDEYLYLLGGDVYGNYAGSSFDASWDQNFYFLNISGSDAYEALYVFDQGDGSKKVPTMYFPEAKRKEVANLQFLDFLFFEFDYWVEQGARFSFLKFSVDEAVGRINNNLALYIANDAGSFSEQPRSAGGLLIPLIYIDAYIQGRTLDTLPGGFNQTVIEWKETIDYNVLTTPAERIFDVIPSTDAVVINMYAFDLGDHQRPPDVRYYDVIRPSKASSGFTVEGVDDGADAPEPVFTEFSSASRLSNGLAFMFVLLFTALW